MISLVAGGLARVCRLARGGANCAKRGIEYGGIKREWQIDFIDLLKSSALFVLILSVSESKLPKHLSRRRHSSV